MNSTSGFLKRRVAEPLLAFMKQGLTPAQLALTVALGTSLSICPFVGTTTITCTLAAFIFRLNLGAIQVVNYAMFPVQLILMVPFIELGVLILGAEPIPFSRGEISYLAENDPWLIVTRLWDYLLMGVMVWAIALVPTTWALYRVCLPIFRQMEARRKKGGKVKVE
ncbi:MAG TPA: hypothetical protein DCE41_07795 [Cytophagales bacterium]|nr:hypothetical protein [Cytophagales bacterium]HAA19813.1 hypothetical protein [Cytophagales bacterium]HAP64241.1 hypothetical protein [Cytophagales bacterium]